MSPRRAETIAIGTELLGPDRIDSNGAFLSRVLGEHGYEVHFRTVVGDDPKELEVALRIALGRADLVVATGGLGPTVDDLTREAASALLGLPLEEDPAILAELQARYRRHARAMPPTNRRQAQVPRGAEVLPNALGTAPGLLLRTGRAVLALLPGVPSEMERMTLDHLLPRLDAAPERRVHRVLKIAGTNESDVDHRLADVHRSAGPVGWTILAGAGQIEIHLSEWVPAGAAAAEVDRLDAAIASALGDDLFGRDQETLEDVVGRLLGERRQTLAAAESVTGGRIARRLTSVPGASNWFAGGAVVYTDTAKTSLADLPMEILSRHGAVSAETAVALAEGIRRRLAAAWGLATTGYAGPGGGTADMPPGTIFLGLAGPGGTTTRRLLLPGVRAVVQARGAQAALDLLRRALLRQGVSDVQGGTP
ncbi:MAG TPA: competence/damage-inducible protein A [Candidatus Polarisedimenticolia bacterium]|nr:competence/damage-inducible protein A [Candidatus Polarisedimenticolia bacterium]